MFATGRKAEEPDGRGKTAFAGTSRKRVEMLLLLELCMRNTPASRSLFSQGHVPRVT